MDDVPNDGASRDVTVTPAMLEVRGVADTIIDADRDLNDALRALKRKALRRRFPPTEKSGGRPKGSKRPDKEFPKRYRNGLLDIYNGGKTEIPNQADLAAVLGYSETTLGRRLAQHPELPWPPIWPPK